jgi:phosphomannomutase/phosphoglucomutase
LSIYKPCDIRGHYCTELGPDLYRRWGQVLGGQLPPGAKFVAGGDVRMSTPELLAGLVEGLCRAGLDVVDLGCLPTPMIYYARRRLAAAGCAVVTASHNPPDFNGLKWMVGDRPPTEEDVRLLERGAGNGSDRQKGRKRTHPRTLDVTFDYVAWLQELWAEARAASCHVVLDPMYGCWSGRARRYLHAVFPPMMISTIRDEPDPVFGGHSPDCSRHELLEDLADAIFRERADLGIAFDGDGDRVAFVDDQGGILTAEEATWVLLQSFGTSLAGKPFVYDLKFSDRISDAAEGLGAIPAPERSGHAFIRARMLETAAPFGAEVSGHYFFGELAGGDDGLVAACRMIAFLARSGKPLSEWRRECPAIHVTPDLRLPIDPAQAESLIEEVRETWSQYPQSTIDGVRVNFPDGWALVRTSVTEPLVTCRFEAGNAKKLDRLVRRFCNALPTVGEDLWARYEETAGYAG